MSVKQSGEQDLDISDVQLNKVIDTVKKVYGTDDESLAAEWETARLELEEEWRQNPDEAAITMKEAETGYDRLMQMLMRNEADDTFDPDEDVEQTTADPGENAVRETDQKNGR